MISAPLARWLDSDENPAARLLYHRDFATPQPSEEALRRMRAAVLAWEPVRALLALQEADGRFANATRGFPAQTTFWALHLMAQLGLSAADEPARRALEAIEARHAVEGAYALNGGGSGVLPCYVGLVARSVIALSDANRPSARAALDWLVDHQRFDHRETRAGGEAPWPYRAVESYGGCWHSVSCYHGVVASLRAFSAVPRAERSAALRQRIAEALRYLEIHRGYLHSDSDKPLFRHMTRFFLVGDYRLHLLDVLESLAEADPALVERPWVQAALEHMGSLADEQGRVPLVTNYARRLLDPLPFEPEGAPSRLLTLQWLRTRRRFGLTEDE